MSDLVAIASLRTKRRDRSCNEPNGHGDTVARANDMSIAQTRRSRE
jgi:hypothetical protein